jgi:phosphoglycolate phosphatase-like HAD superfamily hydrolase
VTRIILWDVDMTLLYSGGAGSLAFKRAFEQLYGIPDAFSRVEFTGRTDSFIFRSGLEQYSLLDEADGKFERELRRFKERYFSVLERTLAEAEGGRVLPGVPEALAALSKEDRRMRQGLATGNFRRAAFMKLRHFKLEGYLEEGGFGDDAEDRNKLVGIAIERMAAGDEYDPSNVWVIGDTLLDIKAAQANGAHALAVATGPLTVDELLAQGADVAFEDLSDTKAVMRVLLG